MSLNPKFLPPAPRAFAGQRWLNIGLRGLHLVGVAGVAGGFLFDLPLEAWMFYWHLAAVTGVLMSLIYLWIDCDWITQLKGQVIVFKVVLLWLALAWPAAQAPVFVVVIVLSAFFAHAPAKVRSWAWGRQVRVCGTEPGERGND